MKELSTYRIFCTFVIEVEAKDKEEAQKQLEKMTTQDLGCFVDATGDWTNWEEVKEEE